MANSSSSSSSSKDSEKKSASQANSPARSVGDVNIMTAPPSSKPTLELGGPSSSAIPPPPAAKPGLGIGPLDLLPFEGSAAAATSPAQAQLGAGGGSTAAATVPGSGEGAATSGTRRKRGRPSEGGAQVPLVIGGDRRGRGELDAPRNAEPACSLCGKKFGSWKAYFGHLRAHPDREWRGAFPPPKGGDSAAAGADSSKLLEQELAPTLLEIAEQTLTKIRAGGDQETPGGSTRGLAINIDLNRNPYDEAGPSTADAPKGFDLNMLPPPDDEEDEDEDEADEGNVPGDDKGKGKMI